MVEEVVSSFKRTVNPGLPYTLAEARAQLKNEEETYDDALVTTLIKASNRMAEQRTGCAFMQSTWECVLSEWSHDCNDVFKLYPGPLVKVSSIQYYPSGGGAITTLATSKYRVHTNPVPGYIEYIDDLPDVDDRQDAVKITFVAGYGADGDNEATQQTALAAAVPDVIDWMKVQLATLYSYREALVAGKSVANISTFMDMMIYPYIII